MPRLYIISGPNGSGKTTASYSVLPELLDCSEFVNSDEFAKHLSPFAPESAYITASRLMLRKVNYLFDRREDFCIETTLATRALLKMTRNAQEKGYYVTVLYFWLSQPEIAIERVAKRVQAGGHDIPEETIRRRYYMGLNYLFHQYMQTCDKWILADNSNPPFEVIAEGSKKGLVIRDMAKYNIVRGMVTDNLQPQTPIENVTEFIAKEIAKAPLAHDGVPYQSDQVQNDLQ
ncbi:MAG: zeta toxin family protein [Bacteroidales bacterium]|nr:zeta toxin family protein [Bacteroidales bacterium]